MKRIWLKYIPVVLVSICFTSVAPVPAYSAEPIYIAQSAASYNRYMRLGYAATARRDYRTALVNFRRALSIRPGNRYATNAIRNVSKYASRGKKVAYRRTPTGTGSPGNRIGAGTRGICLSGEKRLTALVPETQSAQAKTVLGLTVAEYPVLFFYVPQNSGKTLELALVDPTTNQKYEKLIATPSTAGIVSVDLSSVKNLPPLKVGNNYQWYFSLVCDPNDRSQDEIVEGFVQRVEPDAQLKSDLQKATPRDRVSVYVVNDLWYDSLATLAQLRQASPNDASLTEEWVNLLSSIGLDNIATEPLVKPRTK